jgi:signal transduction histidine kinase
LRLLLLEDDSGDADLVRFAVRRMDSTTDVRWVRRLQDALECAASEPFDVILSDLTLPDAHGLDAVTALRQRAPTVPLVVLTSQAHGALVTSALDQGAQDYLIKDEVNPQSLRRSIRHSVQRHGLLQDKQRLLGDLEEKTAVLEDRNERLRQLNESAYQFVDNVSHDFRTPLTVIREYASLIHGGCVGVVNDEQRQMLSVIDTRVDDLNTMVDDMLDMSKLEAGFLRVCRRSCRVDEVIRHVLPVLERKALEREVILQLDPAEGAPDVFCDRDKVGRVIMNLAVNALKFCRQRGKVCLSSRWDVHENEVVVAVTDNGPGIAEEQLAHIFERFRQLDNGARCGTKGFGLGLSIAKQFVNLNFGRMGVESRVGEGSTFWFTLPSASLEHVVTRYAATYERHDSSLISLLTAGTDPTVSLPCSEALDEFLQDLVRCDELVYRVSSHRWLVILSRPTGNVAEFIRDASRQLDELNRNRVLGELPSVTFEHVGTWPAPTALREVLAYADNTHRHMEPTLA